MIFMMSRFNEETVRHLLSLIHRDSKQYNMYVNGVTNAVKTADDVITILKKSDCEDVTFDINDCSGSVKRFCYLKITIMSDNASESSIVSNSVVEFLKGMFFSNPICAINGNKNEILYYMNVKDTTDNEELIGRFNDVLSIVFGSDTCSITVQSHSDETCRLYGCGDSSIVMFPDKRMTPCQAYMKTVAEMQNVKPIPDDYNNYNPVGFNVAEFLLRNEIVCSHRVSCGRDVFDILGCIENNCHGGACIVKEKDGAIWYCCKRARCDHNWQYIVNKIIGRNIGSGREFGKHNRNNEKIPSIAIMPNIDDDEMIENKYGPKALNARQLNKMRKESHIEYIKTGYDAIDKALEGGLAKGQLSIFTGAPGGGKTTFTASVMLNAIEQGMSVFHYCGELNGSSTWTWISQQAAGPIYCREDEVNGGWFAPDAVIDEVENWFMDNNYLLYNNHYGMDYDRILKTIVELTAEHKFDLIVLDNLMSLDIEGAGSTENESEKRFILLLSEFCKMYNVHIILAVHPSKSGLAPGTIIGKIGINGSMAIVNAADVIISMYRCDDEFKQSTKANKKWPDDHPAYQGTNALNFIKSRYTSCQGLWIPLWYCYKSKRMKQSISENKHYGWETKEALERIAEAEDRTEIPYECMPNIAFGSQRDWVKTEPPVENSSPTCVPGIWVHSEDGINEYYDSNGTHMPRTAVSYMYHDIMRRPTKAEKAVKNAPVPGQIGMNNKFENIEKRQIEACKLGIDSHEMYIPDDIDQEMPFEEPDKSVIDKEQVNKNIKELEMLIDNCIYDKNFKSAKMFASTSWQRWTELASKGDATCAETVRKMEKNQKLMKWCNKNWRCNYENE